MPQLDVSTWPPQLIWLAIAFITLYIVMAKVALPRVGGVIDARRNRITHDIEQAERLKVETEKAAADYQATLADARARGHEVSLKMRAEMSAEAEKQQAKVDAEISARTAAAEKRIADMKVAALKDIRSVAGELAADIVGRFTGTKVAANAIAGAIDAERQD